MEELKDRISVAMSIYKNDKADELLMALRSVIRQTVKPYEIVVVGDGAIPDTLLAAVHTAEQEAAAEQVKLRFLPQKENRGLGEALRIACENCACPFIARMDSDDLSHPQRFEWQMAVFKEHPEIGMVGGMITEFEDTPENIVARRILPLSNDDIYKMMRSRCGVNHVTVVMRKEALMAAGNYSGRFRQEDYYLWARMMKNGVRIANIPQVVVNVRSGVGQFARRRGLSYFRQHIKVFEYMYAEGLIPRRMLWKNYALRFAQAVFPAGLLTWVYQHLLRN